MAAKRATTRSTEREVTVLLDDFATLWSELFRTEQTRIVQLETSKNLGEGGAI